ncbi:PadR family transcriptional regulator [Bacillus massiliigorillae]|uniref:PadR family transcriptional regulator n=1 Tax=Bacillus massiliigorillae TaxID=1243664 RepID=UPI00039C5DF0|nr:PadR family transcriptional regulator [Bacillus massiliigorillae]
MNVKGKKRGARGKRKGRIQLAVLQLLRHEHMHGYQIMKRLEEKSDGYYTPSAGTIYPALQDLHEKGFVTIHEENDKKLYSLNPNGEEYLQELGIEEESFWDHWRRRIIWKQTTECMKIHEELQGWEIELKKAEIYVSTNLEHAQELMDIITDARGRLASWNENHNQ